MCDGRTKARGVVKDATLTSPSVVCKSVFRVVTLSNLPTLPPGYLGMFTHFGGSMHSLRTILIYNRSVSLRSEPLVVVQYNTARSTVNARKLCLINSWLLKSRRVTFNNKSRHNYIRAVKHLVCYARPRRWWWNLKLSVRLEWSALKCR